MSTTKDEITVKDRTLAGIGGKYLDSLSTDQWFWLKESRDSSNYYYPLCPREVSDEGEE